MSSTEIRVALFTSLIVFVFQFSFGQNLLIGQKDQSLYVFDLSKGLSKVLDSSFLYNFVGYKVNNGTIDIFGTTRGKLMTVNKEIKYLRLATPAGLDLNEGMTRIRRYEFGRFAIINSRSCLTFFEEGIKRWQLGNYSCIESIQINDTSRLRFLNGYSLPVISYDRETICFSKIRTSLFSQRADLVLIGLKDGVEIASFKNAASPAFSPDSRYFLFKDQSDAYILYDIEKRRVREIGNWDVVFWLLDDN